MEEESINVLGRNMNIYIWTGYEDELIIIKALSVSEARQKYFDRYETVGIVSYIDPIILTEDISSLSLTGGLRKLS